MTKFTKCSLSDQKQPKEVAVLMVPFPLQGHLNQLLHLSRRIAAYNITVHYIGNSTQNHQARTRIHGFDPKTSPNIIFHDFKLAPYNSPPPNPNAPTKFPFHLQPLMDSSSLLRRPVYELMKKLSAQCKRVVIIYDSLMGSVVQDFINFQNLETYTFHSISAFSIFFYLWEHLGRPFSIHEEIVENVPSMEGCFTPEFVDLIGKQHGYLKLNSGRIYNTCRVIESQFLDHLAKPEITGNKMQWALGPFNPVTTSSGCDKTKRRSYSYASSSCEKCLNWLDQQTRNCVLFVSFGTTTSLSDEQINELAIGLERSNQKFIWVLRDADRGDFNTNEVRKVELPKGFEERIGNRGIIMREWAPQLEILGHPATGGFLSHCGWNSCIESISMGVPIATWPMHSDQPRNAFLITKVLKIGVVMKDWARKECLVKSETVEAIVRKLMASEEGAEVRKRAAELGGAARDAVVEGGATHKELDLFISHITR